MLMVNKSLTILDVSKCSITELGVSHLADALKDQGAIALAQMLIRNQTLK